MASTLLIRRHNETVLRDLERGDLVEFPNWMYSHWGVFVGNGDVVHLAGDENNRQGLGSNSGHVFTICGQRYKKAFARREEFLKVAGQSRAVKNNGKDKHLPPHAREEIVEQALTMIGEIDYNVLLKNCEHFATYCRYGVAKSDQVENLVVGGVAVIAGVALGIFGAIMLSRDSNKEDERPIYM